MNKLQFFYLDTNKKIIAEVAHNFDYEVPTLDNNILENNSSYITISDPLLLMDLGYNDEGSNYAFEPLSKFSGETKLKLYRKNVVYTSKVNTDFTEAFYAFWKDLAKNEPEKVICSLKFN